MRDEAIADASLAAEVGGFELLCPECEVMYATGARCPVDNAMLVRLVFDDPLVGRELDGRFTILEKLGFVITALVFYARGRISNADASAAWPDLILGCLFIVAFFKARR